ncbi:hypothetical protein EDD11_008843 [Mortierella claussenii]|nr:hypothetical protein EDD11_008843 [Mortierella claussenii]
MLPTADHSSSLPSSSATVADHITHHVLADAPSIASVLESTDPAVRALIQAAVAHQQAAEAAAAAAAASGSASTSATVNEFDKDQDIKLPLANLASATPATAPATAVAHVTTHVDLSVLAHSVPAEILQSLIPSSVTATPLVSVDDHAALAAVVSLSGPVVTSAATGPAALTSAPNSVTLSAASPALTSTPLPSTLSVAAVPAISAAPISASTTTLSTTVSTSTAGKAEVTASVAPSSSSASASSTSSSTSSRPFVSTKRFNPDDIFCLGCCRNLSVDHYTCPNTSRIFKSCNACRQKSRINSKKVTKPAVVPTKPTISMDEFGAKLKELEDSQEESSLDVMVRLEGSVEMDPETLKSRGAQIAAQVYESTGYWFSHSRTNDETQSKTRLKIYGCSQREDRRAPPAPKTQSRKRNRPSTKSYFPCKGNLTMTFYHNMNHVRVVYGHKKHAKYDNRKCPDHVRAYVKENLGMAPRQLYENLIETNPGLGITQAQVRYWSHFYKKNLDQDDSTSEGRSVAGERAVDGSGQLATPGQSLIDQSSLSNSSSLVSLVANVEQDSSSHMTGIEKTSSTSSSAGTQEHLLSPQTDEERVQLILASSAALQSLAQSHHVEASLVRGDGSIAISVPMTDMDSSPLTSSMVQRVLSGGGKGLLDFQASLQAVSDAASAGSRSSSSLAADPEGDDAVVQQVTAFMKENDHQQQLLQEQQLQQLQEFQQKAEEIKIEQQQKQEPQELKIEQQ